MKLETTPKQRADSIFAEKASPWIIMGAKIMGASASRDVDKLLGLLREIGPILNADDPDAASHSYSGYTAWQSRVNAILAEQERRKGEQRGVGTLEESCSWDDDSFHS